MKDKEKKEEKSEELDSVKTQLAKKDEEIGKAKSDCEHWKNDYYRVYADMANLRKEIERDHQDVIKYRVEGFVDKLISILDAFDMAFKVEPTTVELKNYLQGFKYVHTQLISLLNDEGVEIINPAINTKFSEKTMQAVQTVEDEGEEHLVKEVQMKGYKLHDHLIRPAMVVVSKKPGDKKEAAEDKKEEKQEENK